MKIDINSASKEELSHVKGIGPALAERIIMNRPYSDLNDLTKVPGIGTNSLESIKSNLTISSQETSSEFQAFVDSLQDESHSNEEMKEVSDEFMDSVLSEEGAEPPRMEENDQLENEDFGVVIPESEILEGEIRILEEEIVPSPESINEKEMEDQQEISRAEVIELEDIQDLDVKEEGESMDDTSTQESFQGDEKVIEKEVEIAKTDSSENWITRSQLIWSMVGTAVFSIILTALITLGILSVTNGGIRYATITDAKFLENQITLLNDATTTMKNDIEGIRTRLDTLETVAGRVATLETRADEVDGALEIIQSSIQKISETLIVVQDDIEALKIAAEKSADFRTGLMQLLLEIDGTIEEGK